MALGHFVYRDGSTSPPRILRQGGEQNFLSEWVHIVDLPFFIIALFMTIVCMALVWYLQEDRTIKAGQPPFLYLLCAGSSLMIAAIFSLSML